MGKHRKKSKRKQEKAGSNSRQRPSAQASDQSNPVDSIKDNSIAEPEPAMTSHGDLAVCESHVDYRPAERFDSVLQRFTEGLRVVRSVIGRDRRKLKITQACLDAIMADLAGSPFVSEQGGMLIGPDDTQDLITHYVKDRNGHSTTASFTIDHVTMNEEIRRVRPARLICVGFVHSHPDGISSPSGGDLAFLRRLFDIPSNRTSSNSCLFPIVCQQTFYPYVVDFHHHESVFPADLQII